MGDRLASRMSKLIGSGDYQVYNDVEYNSLFKGRAPPGDSFEFAGATNAMVFKNREFIGEMVAGPNNSFTTASFPVNPALTAFAPMLASIASNFEIYHIRGLVFEFVSSTSPYFAAGSMGEVMLALQYDANDPVYSTINQMKNSDYCVAAAPYKSVVYGAECKHQPYNGLYTRTGAVTASQPINFTDFGTFVFGVQNTTITPGTVLGSLFVSYDVELVRPRLYLTPVGYGHLGTTISGGSTALVVGQSMALGKSLLYGIFSNVTWVPATQTLGFPQCNVGDTYMVTCTCGFGGATTVNGLAAPTLTGCTLLTAWGYSSTTSFNCGNGGTGLVNYGYSILIQMSPSAGVVSSVKFGVGTTGSSTGQQWDIYLTVAGSSLAAV
jgi:hypothetical protein